MWLQTTAGFDWLLDDDEDTVAGDLIPVNVNDVIEIVLQTVLDRAAD